MRIAYVSESKEVFISRGFSNEEAAELNSPATIKASISAIESLGHTVEYIPDIKAIAARLVLATDKGDVMPWDLVYNDCSGVRGRARESQLPGLLEAYGIPYTHSDPATMAICLEKPLAKMFFEHHHIPTAPFVVIPYENIQSNRNNAHDLTNIAARIQSAILPSRHKEALQRYPLFVKPAAEGTAKGIGPSSKCNTQQELESTVADLFSRFPGQDILVETWLGGRELTVSLAGTGAKAKVIGVREMCWDEADGEEIDSYEQKTSGLVGTIQSYKRNRDPTKDPAAAAAAELALEVWRLVKGRDMGRIDTRYHRKGPGAILNVLEINPIVGMVETHSPLPVSAKSFGYSYQDLFRMVIESASERYGLEKAGTA